MCLQGELRHLCTPAVARELRRLVAQVGARPGFIRLVEQYLSTAEVVEPVAVPERAADPEDQKFLECAAAGADYLVSSDNHLLDVRGAGRALVVKPGRFLRYLEEEKVEKLEIPQSRVAGRVWYRWHPAGWLAGILPAGVRGGGTPPSQPPGRRRYTGERDAKRQAGARFRHVSPGPPVTEVLPPQ